MYHKNTEGVFSEIEARECSVCGAEKIKLNRFVFFKKAYL